MALQGFHILRWHIRLSLSVIFVVPPSVDLCNFFSIFTISIIACTFIKAVAGGEVGGVGSL